MPTITVTEARRQLYRLLDEVCESHEPVHIAGKRSSGVLVSEEDWRAITETLRLSEIPGIRDSIVKGMKEPLDKCSNDPGW